VNKRQAIAIDGNKASFPKVIAGKKKYMKQDDKRTRAVTLTELLVMMAVMVILLAIAAPVAQKLAQSLGNSAGARNIIDAAMTSARAIAVREHLYAGVRFQQDNTGRQYLVFIINDPNATSYVNGFRAVKGRKPTALPEGVGVMSCRVQQSYTDDKSDDRDLTSINPLTAADQYLDSDVEMNDATTFSIVFSSSGKFVTHLVRVSNRGSNDKVFNTPTKVTNGEALFRQDESESPTPSVGYQEENSVPSFKIYERSKLAKVAANKRWSGYLSTFSTEEYVNPYTGELVKKN
jgi:Tfp pilus assembly protein PilE